MENELYEMIQTLVDKYDDKYLDIGDWANARALLNRYSADQQRKALRVPVGLNALQIREAAV